MNALHPNTLKALGVPEGLASAYAVPVGEVMRHYSLATDQRATAFLARACGPETSGLTRMEERGNGHNSRLVPPRDPYFDRYNGRLGNGPAPDGDHYRGRGMMQTTGRRFYTHYRDHVRANWNSYTQRFPALTFQPAPDFVANPALLTQQPWCFDSAGYWWRLYDPPTTHKLDVAADMGNFDEVSRLINGGTNGLAEYRASVRVASTAIARQPAAIPEGSNPVTVSQASTGGGVLGWLLDKIIPKPTLPLPGTGVLKLTGSTGPAMSTPPTQTPPPSVNTGLPPGTAAPSGPPAFSTEDVMTLLLIGAAFHFIREARRNPRRDRSPKA